LFFFFFNDTATTEIYTYWVANYNNRLPTLIDGAWDVVSVSPQNEGNGNAPAIVFFERNRAYMCVFKRRDGSYEQHHFEVDENKRTITIWDQWLSKGKQIFAGAYELSGDELRLSGKFVNSTEETILVLKRRNQSSAIASPPPAVGPRTVVHSGGARVIAGGRTRQLTEQGIAMLFQRSAY
jgi:hypothetical protein